MTLRTDSEYKIVQAWAKNLNNEALLESFQRYIDNPRGWRSFHVSLLLQEVHDRFQARL
jgi:hypothetical protein